MSMYSEEIDGLGAWASHLPLASLPMTQRLRPRENEQSTGILSGMLFFDAMGEALLKNSRLSEVGKAVRSGVIPKFMVNYIDLLEDDFVLQIEGAGPSVWSDDTSRTTVSAYRNKELAKVSVSISTSGSNSSGSSSSSSTASGDSNKRPHSDVGGEISVNKIQAVAAAHGNSVIHRRQSMSDLREHVSDKVATSFISSLSQIISTVRANIDQSFLHVLDSNSEYRECEETYNLLEWWTVLQEKTYFAVVSKDQFAADLHRSLASCSHVYFNYVKSGVTFDVLAARYIEC